MNAKEIEKFLAKNGDKYIAAYGLQHWCISIEVDDNEDTNTVGECDTDYIYQKATITLFSEGILDESDLHETLCHELEHILDSPFDMYFALVNQFLPANVKRATDSVFNNCVELARNNIGRFRANFFLEPPSQD